MTNLVIQARDHAGVSPAREVFDLLAAAVILRRLMGRVQGVGEIKIEQCGRILRIDS
jgi:hypothetical protein